MARSEAAVNSLQKAESCSRERSRLARAALNKARHSAGARALVRAPEALTCAPGSAQLVLSVTSSTRAQLTPACPWHPERDLFAVQEQQKQRVHDTHWRARDARQCA